jgi:putative peptidoglycan lipid II flippase
MSLIRVSLATIVGYFAAVRLPPLLGVDLRYGAVALTAVAGMTGWIEFLLLRNRLERRIGSVRLPAGALGRLLLASTAGALVAAGADWMFAVDQPILRAVVALVPFGLAYLGTARMLGLNEADTFMRRFRRR